MASAAASASKVAKFVRQLYGICSDPSNHEIIRFRRDGASFEVLNVRALEDVVFPTVFKHRNFASFHRQLLTHEFVKIGSLNEYVYKHPSFRRDRLDLLPAIRRVAVKSETKARSAAKGGDDDSLDDEPQHDVLAALEARFEDLEAEVSAMRADHGASVAELKQENAKLWNIIVAQEEAQAFVQTALRALFSYLSSNGIVDLSSIFDPVTLGHGASKKRKRDAPVTTEAVSGALSRLSILPPVPGAATPAPDSSAARFSKAAPTLASLSRDFGAPPSPLATPLSSFGGSSTVWPRAASQMSWTVPAPEVPITSAYDPESLRAELRARKRDALLFDIEADESVPLAPLPPLLAEQPTAAHAAASTLESLASTVLDALAEGAAERAAMIRSYQSTVCKAEPTDDCFDAEVRPFEWSAGEPIVAFDGSVAMAH